MDRVLPHNEDSEKIVLGSILLDTNAFSEISPFVTSEMFYNTSHQEIYKNILALIKRGKSPDIVLLSEKYREDHEAIMKLVDISNCFSNDYLDHAYNVQEKYLRREMWRIGTKLANDALSNRKEIETLVIDLQNKISSLNQNVSQSEISTFRDALKCVYKQIESNLNGEHLTGTDSGFEHINKATGGLQKSDLIIIAGETSQGKTSLALSIIEKGAKTGEGVAIYSMEMKKEQLTARILSMNSGIPSNEILFSQLDSNYLKLLDVGVNQIEDLPIYFDDNSTSNIDKIISSIRTMKIKYNISGAVIDYLQILNVNQKSQNKEQAMGDVARRLKNLAKDLDIWVIALSQLNRDNTNPIPNLNRLRDSGQIAEAADIVMFVYRPEVYNKFYPQPFVNYSTHGTAMIDIAKGRNIGLLKFICSFDSKTTHFLDIGEKISEVTEDAPF